MEKKEWTVGVFAAIFDPEKKILLLKRRDGKGWNLSGGGVDFKKDSGPISTMVREVWEETGLPYDPNLIQPDLVGIYPSEKLKDIAILFLLTYSERQTGGQPVFETNESSEYRFVDRKTLKNEIQLVSQQYPGNEFGRHWKMVNDAFDFVEKNYQKVMDQENCIDCGGYGHEHTEYPFLRRKE